MLYINYNYRVKGSNRIAQDKAKSVRQTHPHTKIQITEQLYYYKLSYIGFGIEHATLHSASNAIY